MSYILDAIRKSDQQRKHGAVPTLPTAQAAVEVTSQPAFSLNGLLAAVLMSAGLVIGWLRPWQPEQPAPAPTLIDAKPLATSPGLAAPAPLPALPELARKSGAEPAGQKSMPAEQSATGFGGTATTQDILALVRQESRSTPAGPVADVPKEAGTPMPAEPVGTALDARQKQGEMAFDELPPSIRQGIPSMSISFHFYSASSRERRVMINDAMLRQGDSIAPGLRLEQITPDGVILGYKGYRFQRGVR
jgi:general secretion pathway protein B